MISEGLASTTRSQGLKRRKRDEDFSGLVSDSPGLRVVVCSRGYWEGEPGDKRGDRRDGMRASVGDSGDDAFSLLWSAVYIR